MKNGLNHGFDRLLDDADDGMAGAVEELTATEGFMYCSEADLAVAAKQSKSPASAPSVNPRESVMQTPSQHHH